MTPETQTANLRKLRFEEVAETVLPHQARLLRDLIAFQTVSTPTPMETFTREAGAALVARRSALEPGPTIGFNGHLDVAPIEDPAKWQSDPLCGLRDTTVALALALADDRLKEVPRLER